MSLDPALEQLSREELVQRARSLGARRPEVMTRIELRDEIVRLSEVDPVARRRSRGWLGVARDLVASVMDAGLNMPGAAAAIRGDARPAEETTGPPPVATLTLAEIYLAQGHTDRALATLEEVLTAEPEHAAALALRERVTSERAEGPARRRQVPPPEPSDVDEPLPAPAPFVASMAQPSFVASVEAPEATRSPELYVSQAAPAPAPAPAPTPELEAPPSSEAWSEAAAYSEFAPEAARPPAPVPAAEPVAAVPAEWSEVDSSVVSQPVPTLAAPPAVDDILPEAPLAARAECALLERGGAIEGLYSLPPGTSGVVLRVAWFVPSHDGPTVGTVDVPLDPVRTRVRVPLVERSAHVRAAIGSEQSGTFQPLAVAWVYRAEARGLSVAFAPPGAESSFLRAEAQALAAS